MANKHLFTIQIAPVNSPARGMAKTARALWAQGKYIAASHVWRRAMHALINEMRG